MKYLGIVVLLLLPSLMIAAPDAVAPTSGVATNTLAVGYRFDELNWNIAPTLNTNTIPNIISELSWKDLSIVQLHDQLDYTFANGNYIGVNISVGKIVSGNNQDSDYAGYNQTNEFSRSNNDAGRGYTLDSTLYLGYDFKLDGNRARYHFIPVVGYGYDSQHLHIYDGVQTLSVSPLQTLPLGPFAGLDSSFDSAWQGPLAGLHFSFQLTPAWQLQTNVDYHWVWYTAVANWNLRSDFEHPVSFSQQADGQGVVFGLGNTYALSQHWQLLLALHYQDWVTAAGTQIFHSSTTFDSAQRLNQVFWHSLDVMAGARVIF